MPSWTKAKTAAELHTCYGLLQSTMPTSFMPELNWNKLNGQHQGGVATGQKMLEAYLYVDLDIVVAVHLSLGTRGAHPPVAGNQSLWCVTVGLSSVTTKSIDLIYQLVKDKIKHMPGGRKHCLVWPYDPTITDLNDYLDLSQPIDQLFNAFLNDPSVTRTPDPMAGDPLTPEGPYGAFTTQILRIAIS